MTDPQSVKVCIAQLITETKIHKWKYSLSTGRDEISRYLILKIKIKDFEITHYFQAHHHPTENFQIKLKNYCCNERG